MATKIKKLTLKQLEKISKTYSHLKDTALPEDNEDEIFKMVADVLEMDFEIVKNVLRKGV